MPRSTAVPGMILCVVLGVISGFGLAQHSAMAIATDDQQSKSRVDECQANLTDTMQQMQKVSSERDKAETNLQALNSALQSMEGQETVLYGFHSASGLPLMNGQITVSPGSSEHPVGEIQPDWIIPLRTQPRCVKCAEFAEYAFIDKKTGAVQGPFRVR